MSLLSSLSFTNILFCFIILASLSTILLWICWVIPNLIKFTLWLTIMILVVVPLLAFWHLGLSLWNLLIFFPLLAPIRALILFALTSISFAIYVLRLALAKVYRYTSRYFIFSSSINIMFDDLDLFWVEILRDWLYPNDDRYRLIYRRWVFWVNNDKYQERYDYYVTFLWGYVARHFVMAIYMGWLYSLRFFHKLLIRYMGTTIGSTVVFFSICFVLLLFKWLPSNIAEFLWVTYRFVYRQVYYLTGNFVTFEILKTLNWNWMEWDVSSNVDEFEEADYTLARAPSSESISFFGFINHQAALLRRHGLGFLKLKFKTFSIVLHLLSQFLALAIGLFGNLLFLCLAFLAQFIPYFFYVQAYLLRHLGGELLKNANFKQLVKFFFKNLSFYLYSVLIASSNFLKPLFQRYVYSYLLFGLAMIFYSLMYLWRFFFLLPLAFLFALRLGGRIVLKLRVFVLIIFLFLIFSKEYLSFFYFFSLGWFSDLVLSTLDNFTLIQHQFYIMPFSTKMGRGRRGVETHVYVLFWMRQFLDALFTYKYYLLKNMQDLIRLRNFWKQVTGWKPWVFFIRFMPFFGQTTFVKKIWFERVYLWLHTPAVLWWCYSGYDRLFRLSWFISILIHIFVFFPHGIFQSWFYYVFWLMPRLYLLGSSFYSTLWLLLLNLRESFSYLAQGSLALKPLFSDILHYLTYCLGWAIKRLLTLIGLLVWCFWTVFFLFSWAHFAYIYLCFNEIVDYWVYSLICYRWLLGICFGDFTHWLFYFGNMFSGWMHFYFVYGFFFNYLSLSWNSLYEWWIANPLKHLYLSFPSIYFLVSLTDYLAINGNPMVYHVAIFLRVQKLLDSLCISLQIPRDVQRNAYIFLRRRILNVKFLRWLLSLRRTPMYSLDRWLMPVFSYFKILETIHLSGQTAFNFSGTLDAKFLRVNFPAAYYGFIWNSYAVYFFVLLIVLILSKDFTRLLFKPFSRPRDQNREYAWKRFREEHPRNLKWMFFDLGIALELQDRVKIHYDLPTKFFYYEKLLTNVINTAQGSDLKNVMFKFYNQSFWVRRSSLLQSEQDVFISPLFFDFYLKSRYINFRTTIHKGDDLFTFFSAYAYSLNPWIHVAWDSPDQEDYENITNEVTFHAPSRRQFISFHDRVRSLQHKLDLIIFSGKLSAWTLLKEPLNMAIITTSFRDDLGSSSPRASYSASPDIYEFEDDEDITYIPWPILAWFCAVPFMLFYKSFFFLGGFHWHYNRHSPNIMQSYMLYFNSAIGHIQLIAYMRKLMGDNYFLHKREGGAHGHIHNFHYRSYIRNVIRRSFYSYKLPYRGVNSWLSLEKISSAHTVSFKFQFLSYSILEELRVFNLVLLLWIAFGLILFRNDVSAGHRKHVLPLGYPINSLRLINTNSIKLKIKHLYLWFWR